MKKVAVAVGIGKASLGLLCALAFALASGGLAWGQKLGTSREVQIPGEGRIRRAVLAGSAPYH